MHVCGDVEVVIVIDEWKMPDWIIDREGGQGEEESEEDWLSF